VELDGSGPVSGPVKSSGANALWHRLSALCSLYKVDKFDKLFICARLWPNNDVAIPCIAGRAQMHMYASRARTWALADHISICSDACTAP
jgi:hypothetical protein